MQGHISVSVLQEVMVLGMVYNISIYHINSNFQIYIDVSRIPCGINNMDIVYAIAIYYIKIPKVDIYLECYCIHIIYIYLDEFACSLILLLYVSII